MSDGGCIEGYSRAWIGAERSDGIGWSGRNLRAGWWHSHKETYEVRTDFINCLEQTPRSQPHPPLLCQDNLPLMVAMKHLLLSALIAQLSLAAALVLPFDSWPHQRIRLPDVNIHFRYAGSGPPLLLVHGFPQYSVCTKQTISRPLHSLSLHVLY